MYGKTCGKISDTNLTIISSEIQCKDDNERFTTVPLKP